jgi:hypothetical protein
MSTDVFVGTWRLVSVETRTAGGEVSQPLGKDPSGYLMYSEDGHMAVAMMQANRRPFDCADIRGGTLEEKAAAVDTYLSYCGRYEVVGGKVIHHIELSLFPNWSGVDQERFFEFSGDLLTLRTPPVMIEGVEQTAQLVWQRAKRR